jgi:transposase
MSKKRTRFIGVRHRIKKTAEGESRPTQVAILEDSVLRILELEDEQAELDFVYGRFPLRMRPYVEGEDLSVFPSHQIVYKKVGEKGEEKLEPHKVPDVIEGLHAGDCVAMMLGGSGDYLACGFSRQGDEIGAEVIRIQPAKFKEWRKGIASEDKSEDAALLAQLAGMDGSKELFYETSLKDRDFIRFRIAYIARTEAMKARIAAEQRLRQNLVGKIFTDPKGLYPEGGLEKAWLATKATDQILINLEVEEALRLKELEKALRKVPAWAVFDKIIGFGPAITARVVAGVGDIRRFKSESAFIKFCGLSVDIVGEGDNRKTSIQRQRRGATLGFNPDVRQGFYLFGDQINRRKGTHWNDKLQQFKKSFREKYPVAEVVAGKKRNTDGHIHKKAMWRTLTRFAGWLYKEWLKTENEARGKKAPQTENIVDDTDQSKSAAA